MTWINVVTPLWAHKNSRQNLYKRLEAKLGCFATRSQKSRKRSSKKPTEQDFVSTSPNLDALRNDKEDAATAAERSLHRRPKHNKTKPRDTSYQKTFSSITGLK